jgi:hypothetical protein
MHPGNHLLLAGALVGAFLSSDAARAQAGGPLNNEKWLCTDKARADEGKPPLEFVLQNGALIAQPLGAPRYHVLDNTPYGLIAADYSADMDIGFVSVYVSTMLIDRMSGNFVSSVTSSGSAPELRTGQCKLVQVKADATVAVSAPSK